jgi:hypothetical protein
MIPPSPLLSLTHPHPIYDDVGVVSYAFGYVCFIIECIGNLTLCPPYCTQFSNIYIEDSVIEINSNSNASQNQSPFQYLSSTSQGSLHGSNTLDGWEIGGTLLGMSAVAITEGSGAGGICQFLSPMSSGPVALGDTRPGNGLALLTLALIAFLSHSTNHDDCLNSLP